MQKQNKNNEKCIPNISTSNKTVFLSETVMTYKRLLIVIISL